MWRRCHDLGTTMSDVERGYTSGPYTEEEVAKIIGTNKFRPTPRHPIVQKGKVREIEHGFRSREPR